MQQGGQQRGPWRVADDTRDGGGLCLGGRRRTRSGIRLPPAAAPPPHRATPAAAEEEEASPLLVSWSAGACCASGPLPASWLPAGIVLPKQMATVPHPLPPTGPTALSVLE